jgi:ABC-type Fe3+/spermidine/putrescine transport system ATPase subunit
VQSGSPDELYWQPSSVYVARALGSVNELHGTVAAVEGEAVVFSAGDLRIRAKARSKTALRAGESATALIRFGTPTFGASASGENVFDGVVREAAFMGEVWRSTVQLGTQAQGTALQIVSLRNEGAVGEHVRISIPADEVVVLPQAGPATATNAQPR